MKSTKIYLISVILLFSFLINFYFGHQGLMPLDDLQNFNSGFRVLNGDFPFRDYYSITGPFLDIWQANIFNLFGLSWQSFVIHASLMNCLYSLSIFLFLTKLKFNFIYSFFYSFSAGLLMYPPAGTPTVEHNSLILSVVALLIFIIGLKENEKKLLVISIFLFGISFFTKQVPTAYFIIFCAAIYISQIFSKLDIPNFITILISSISVLIVLLAYFSINNVSLLDIYEQYFIIASSLGKDRFNILNFNIFYENISKLFFLLFLLIPSFYIFLIKKKKDVFLLIAGFCLIIIFYEIHSNNQPITFALLPLLLSFFHYYYTREKLNLRFVEYFFYLIIFYTFFRILRYENLYLIILSFFIFFIFLKKKVSISLLFIVYLFISSSLYFEKYIKIRAWDDLKKNDLSSSFDAVIIDPKLKRLNWKTIYFEDTNKEKILIFDTLNYIKSLDPKTNYILISDYQIYNLILNKEDHSPVKYWFKDATYPNKNHKLRNKFESFFKHKLINKDVSQIILDNTAKFSSDELIEFPWLYKCLEKQKDLLFSKDLEIFLIKKNCIL